MNPTYYWAPDLNDFTQRKNWRVKDLQKFLTHYCKPDWDVFTSLAQKTVTAVEEENGLVWLSSSIGLKSSVTASPTVGSLETVLANFNPDMPVELRYYHAPLTNVMIMASGIFLMAHDGSSADMQKHPIDFDSLPDIGPRKVITEHWNKWI